MGDLPRPPTSKEFVIRSLLRPGAPAPSWLDREEVVASAPPPPEPVEAALPPPRASQASIVFDLGRPARASCHSFADGELQRDTLPSPPPSMHDGW